MVNERTNVNYKPLWKILIDRGISKACMAPGCGMDDIVEIGR